jgi:hypothetical protein
MWEEVERFALSTIFSNWFSRKVNNCTDYGLLREAWTISITSFLAEKESNGFVKRCLPLVKTPQK